MRAQVRPPFFGSNHARVDGGLALWLALLEAHQNLWFPENEMTQDGWWTSFYSFPCSYGLWQCGEEHRGLAVNSDHTRLWSRKLTSSSWHCQNKVHNMTRDVAVLCPVIPDLAILRISRLFTFGPSFRNAEANKNPSFLDCSSLHPWWYGGWITLQNWSTWNMRPILSTNAGSPYLFWCLGTLERIPFHLGCQHH